MIEAKITTLLDVALNVLRGNIYDNYIVWGRVKSVKGEKDSTLHSNR